MKKVLVIGDIHGRSNWKQIIKDNAGFDYVVFLGDYVDTRDDISGVEILHNLKEILSFKDENPNTILLIGNHDYQYIYGYMGQYPCSGFQGAMYHDYHALFIENLHQFQFVHQEGEYLFSHAGITKKWYDKYEQFLKDHAYMITDGEADELLEDIPFLINEGMATKEIQDAMWEVGPERGGSFDGNGSPIWADQNETRFGVLRGYNHVVGHTPQTKTGVKYFKIDNTTGVWYCDAIFHNVRNHLILEINEY